MQALAITVYLIAATCCAAEPPHIVFIAGDDEYRSEESMPMLAGIMKKHHGCKVTCLFPINAKGEIDPNVKDNIPHLDVLDSADLMVVYCRWRALKKDQLEHIARYAQSGKPMAGFRTATHTFKYDDPSLSDYNDNWPIKVFGQKWISHHGHFGDGEEFLTDVTIADSQADNAVLRGIKPFKAYSWLYHVDGGNHRLAGNAERLLIGKALKTGHAKRLDQFPITNPVAWTKKYVSSPDVSARVFFTTLGHPFDFRDVSMRKLAVNGFLWALGKEKEIPPEGGKADLTMPYDPPNSGINNFRKGRKPADVRRLIDS